MSETPETDPKNAAHWEAVEEATELLHEERFTEALLALRRVIQADATNPYAFHFLGVALFEVGELEASRDAYRAALRLAPEYLGSRIGLSHVLRMGNDLREAIREGLQALSQAPGDSEALYAVGLAYLARGDHAATRRYFEAFLEARPEYETAEEVRSILATLTEGSSRN